MKYSVCMSLLLSCFGIWAAEKREQSVRPGGYFESPSVVFKLLTTCRPIINPVHKQEALVFTGMSKKHEDEMRYSNADNMFVIQAKIDFFLRYKHLPPGKRQQLWEDPELEDQYTTYQEWLAQKAQEPTPSPVEKRETAVSKPGSRLYS